MGVMMSRCFCREVLAIGPYRFTGRDDVTLRSAGSCRTEMHGIYSTSTPSAGMGYELNLAVPARA